MRKLHFLLPQEAQERELNLQHLLCKKLSKEDDINSYLDMFERVAVQQGWPKETRATQLAGLLSGEP